MLAIFGTALFRRSPHNSSHPFRMPIDDAFALKLPGKVVVVGVIAEGEVRPGDHLTIQCPYSRINVQVEGLEAYHKPLRVAKRGDRVGLMLIGATKEQICSGAVLVKENEVSEG